MHCVYCNKTFKTGAPLEIDERERQHLFKILRARTGEVVNVIDGTGTLGEAVITAGNIIIINSITAVSAPAQRIHLYLAVPRKQKMDQILKQCAELGIWSITPIICEHSVVIPDLENTPERWRNLLIEGCKQAKNPYLPLINNSCILNFAAAQINSSGAKAFFGEQLAVREAEITTEDTDLAWFVGPEGGFSTAEKAMLMASGVKPLALGRWILRVETAAICGAAVLLNSCK
jgi:16S rRNA (uracil1498-N3)-methyltransferase